MSFSAERVQGQLKRVLGILRFTPFDTTTQEGRSKERYRRVILSAAASIIAKAITALTTLISIPLTVNYLGAERYGMWMTISSLIAMMAFADLGMGNGLVNSIADANGRDDRAEARRYVSSGFFMLLAVSTLILIAFLTAYTVVPWDRVFNVTSVTASQEAGPALAVFVFCLIVTIPLSVVERVQLGYQEGFVSNIWQSVGSLAGLGAVLLAIQLQAGLPWLVLAMAGPPALTIAINWAIQFWMRRPWLCPRWNKVDREAIRKLVNLGSLFLILQGLTMIGSASDNLIIAQIFGASAVAGYAVVQKLFSIALLSQFFVSPLWPAFGEALARSDYLWARRTLFRAVLLSVGLGIMVAVPFLMFGQSIIAFWVGDALIPSLSLLGGFAAYTVLGAYGGAMSSFLNSSFLLRRQVSFYSVASIVALLLKVMLAWHWQVAGVVWATVLAYGTLYAVPAGILSYRALSDLQDLQKDTYANHS